MVRSLRATIPFVLDPLLSLLITPLSIILTLSITNIITLLILTRRRRRHHSPYFPE